MNYVLSEKRLPRVTLGCLRVASSFSCSRALLMARLNQMTVQWLATRRLVCGKRVVLIVPVSSMSDTRHHSSSSFDSCHIRYRTALFQQGRGITQWICSDFNTSPVQCLVPIRQYQHGNITASINVQFNLLFFKQPLPQNKL